MSSSPDWHKGIKPTLEETTAAARRAREELKELVAVVDELFPPESAPRQTVHRQYGADRGLTEKEAP